MFAATVMDDGENALADINTSFVPGPGVPPGLPPGLSKSVFFWQLLRMLERATKMTTLNVTLTLENAILFMSPVF